MIIPASSISSSSSNAAVAAAAVTHSNNMRNLYHLGRKDHQQQAVYGNGAEKKLKAVSKSSTVSTPLKKKNRAGATSTTKKNRVSPGWSTANADNSTLRRTTASPSKRKKITAPALQPEYHSSPSPAVFTLSHSGVDFKLIPDVMTVSDDDSTTSSGSSSNEDSDSDDDEHEGPLISILQTGLCLGKKKKKRHRRGSKHTDMDVVVRLVNFTGLLRVTTPFPKNTTAVPDPQPVKKRARQSSAAIAGVSSTVHKAVVNTKPTAAAIGSKKKLQQPRKIKSKLQRLPSGKSGNNDNKKGNQQSSVIPESIFTSRITKNVSALPPISVPLPIQQHQQLPSNLTANNTGANTGNTATSAVLHPSHPSLALPSMDGFSTNHQETEQTTPLPLDDTGNKSSFEKWSTMAAPSFQQHAKEHSLLHPSSSKMSTDNNDSQPPKELVVTNSHTSNNIGGDNDFEFQDLLSDQEGEEFPIGSNSGENMIITSLNNENEHQHEHFNTAMEEVDGLQEGIDECMVPPVSPDNHIFQEEEDEEEEDNEDEKTVERHVDYDVDQQEDIAEEFTIMQPVLPPPPPPPTAHTLVPSGPHPPPSGRWGHTLTPIPQTSTCVIYGGQCHSIAKDCPPPRPMVTCDDVHIFDTSTKSWSGSLTIQNNDTTKGRCWHTATHLPHNNSILLLGGEDSNNSSTTPQLLHLGDSNGPIVPCFTTPPLNGPAVHHKRSGHTATLLPSTNELLLFGGVSTATGKWLNSLSVLQTDSWKWSNTNNSTKQRILGDFPQPRSYHTAVLLGDEKRVVILGGNDEAKSFGGQSVSVLDTSRAVWSWFHPTCRGRQGVPSGRTGQAAILMADGTSILVYGGWDPSSEEEEEDVFGDAWLLDTETWDWSRVNDLRMEKQEDDEGAFRVGHSLMLLPQSISVNKKAQKTDNGDGDTNAEQSLLPQESDDAAKNADTDANTDTAAIKSGEDVLVFGGRLPNNGLASDLIRWNINTTNTAIAAGDNDNYCDIENESIE